MNFAASVQLFTTLVLGVVAAYIAWRQWRTSRDRLVFDLFERRFQSFQDLTRTISEAFQQGRAELNDLAKFDVAAEKARFLFGPEVHLYLRDVRSHLINVITKERGIRDLPNGPQRTKYEDELEAGLNTMNEFYGKLAELVTPYLRMATRS